jgi:outer membrane immunogenic protein
MKKIFAVSVLLASAAIAAPAMAQDEGNTFSGPYVAGVIGYDVLNVPSVEKEDGLLYGGIIGYDINLNGVVLGVEGEYSDSNTKYDEPNFFVAGDNLSLRTGRDLYAGVRIGGVVAPNVMVYAKGGYTNARLKANYTVGGVTTEDRDNLEGYRLGAGVETSISGFTTRLEYRYSNYSEYANAGFDLDRHQVAAIIGYRF